MNTVQQSISFKDFISAMYIVCRFRGLWNLEVFGRRTRKYHCLVLSMTWWSKAILSCVKAILISITSSTHITVNLYVSGEAICLLSCGMCSVISATVLGFLVFIGHLPAVLKRFWLWFGLESNYFIGVSSMVSSHQCFLCICECDGLVCDGIFSFLQVQLKNYWCINTAHRLSPTCNGEHHSI